ncbi:hypothetical protein RQP46_006319 [Phenoliferia psychrophenolica]
MAPNGNGTGGGAPAALAAPAWRSFSFFGQKLVQDHADPSLGAPEVVRRPPLISAIASSPVCDLVLIADLDGNVHVISPDYEVVRSWRAYGDGTDGRCTHMVVAEDQRWRGIVVTVGEDPGSPFPVLKVWDLGRTPSAASPSSPTLLRSSRIQHSTRPHPISAIGLSPSLSHVVVGLADGTVVAFRHVDQLLDASLATAQSASQLNGSPAPPPPTAVLSLGKLRVLYEGKEPITGLGFRTTAASASGHRSTTTTLFILTTSHVLSYPISASSKSSATATVLDDLGSALGCCAVMETAEGARMVVARDEAVYVYGSDGREGCYAYEGPKSSIKTLSSAISSTSTSSVRSTYIAIISPPTLPTAASTSATIRNYARNLLSSAPATATVTNGNGATTPTPATDVAKVTIFDLENKFVAHSGTFEEGVRDVWEAWGAVWVLSEAGKLYRLVEQPLANSLSTLFSRNLYTLAVSLAQSRNLPPSEVAEIYRRYGDHLYSKSDYEGAMGCYIKTVGTVQASYVIRKFLDAQRLSHLTSYLQELHSRGLANSDHTTLLLNCYTKLADDTALSSFIHSSSSSSTVVPLPSNSSDPTSEEPPFDLETAIRVCRQAGYFEHAVWLAERYGAHQEYLRIQIEDRSDAPRSLQYLRKLGPLAAEDNLRRYGKTLLGAQPKDTTRLLIDLCCGTLERIDDEEEARANAAGGAQRKSTTDKGYLAYLAYAIPSSGATEATAPIPEPSSPVVAPAVPRSAVANLRLGAASSSSTAIDPAANRRSGIYPQYQVPDSLPPPESTSSPLLPSPRQFFAIYVDHPDEFITFLETVAARRYGKSLGAVPSTMDPQTAPLPEPQPLRTLEFDDADTRDEQAIWNTLLELYLTHSHASTNSSSPSTTTTTTTPGGQHPHSRPVLEAKALQLLLARPSIPYDETQALLVCTTAGFTSGFILLYEQLGMYDDIVRYFVEVDDSPKVIQALRRYGEVAPHLYRGVLRYLTTSSELLSRHQGDIVDILDVVDRENIMPPIAVVQLLSTNGTASIGLVREYLKRQLGREKQEIDSDRGLIDSYRSESAKKRKEILELSDPNVPRIFQVTRCSACGGQLDLPSVHFMCRHSYHQRCLADNESQCPNCARTHGVIREIRRNNEQLAGRHDLFAEEVRESEDGYAPVAAAFGKGLMGLAVGEERA